MSLSQSPDNQQWVVLARYPKGHYRQPVCPGWHIYGDLVFTDRLKAILLRSALRGQGVSAKVHDRALVDTNIENALMVRPKACLKVATGDPYQYIRRQSPTDIALYALYESLSDSTIDTLGEGNWAMFVPLAIQKAVHSEITVKRSLYKAQHHSQMALCGGQPLSDGGAMVAGGTTYKVSCDRYGAPTLGVMRFRVPIDKKDQRVVFGNLSTERFVWRPGIATGKSGVPFQIDIGATDDEWCGTLSDGRTAVDAIDSAKNAIVRYVLLQLFKIKGI